MKLISALVVLLLIGLVPSASAANHGPITMRTGADITFDGGYARYAVEGVANIKDYGAVGDGVTDDTDAIQAALVGGGIVWIPNGDYLIDPADPIYVPNGTTMIFGPDAWLINTDYNLTSYGMLWMRSVNNVSLINPHVDGNRTGQIGVLGQSGHGIRIEESTDIYIENAVSINNWGDGIFIADTISHTAHCNRVYINGARCDNNRRNGMSICDGVDIRVDNLISENTNGLKPESGVDIEPWDESQVLQNIVLNGPHTFNNSGMGIQIHTYHRDASNTSSRDPISITVNDHIDDGNGVTSHNFRIYDRSPQKYWFTPGIVNINNPIWMNSNDAAFECPAKSSDAYFVKILNPTVIDCNRDGGTEDNEDPAFILSYLSSGDTGDASSGGWMIENPTIIFNNTDYGVPHEYMFRDGRIGEDPAEDIYIINPIHVNGSSSDFPFYLSVGMTITDPGEEYTYSADADTDLLDVCGYGTIYTDSAFSADRTYSWSSALFPIGIDLTFRVVDGSHYLTIDPYTDDRIYPTGTGAGKYIRSTTKGSQVVIRKLSDNMWIVKSITGTWEAEA